MGAASYILQQYIDRAIPFTPLHDSACLALKLYWLSFAANMAWTPLFFGLQKPALALVDIAVLTPTVYWLTWESFKVDKRAGLVFAAYS